MTDLRTGPPPIPAEAGYGADYLTWKTWDGHPFGQYGKTKAAYFRAEIKRLGVPPQAGARMLEIGFGNGDFLKFAADNGWDVCGTEINAELVDVAKAHGYTATHAEGLAGFADESFDYIFAFDVLEHITHDNLLHLIGDAKRILRPGGVFFARFPNGDSPFGLIHQNGDMTHLTFIGSGKAEYLAQRAGLSIIFIGGAAHAVFGASTLSFVHGLITMPIKYVLNAFVNLVFLPGRNIAFLSPNLTMILGKSMPS